MLLRCPWRKKSVRAIGQGWQHLQGCSLEKEAQVNTDGSKRSRWPLILNVILCVNCLWEGYAPTCLMKASDMVTDPADEGGDLLWQCYFRPLNNSRSAHH